MREVRTRSRGFGLKQKGAEEGWEAEMNMSIASGEIAPFRNLGRKAAVLSPSVVQ